MTALKVLLVILLVLFLIGLVRVGGSVEYSAAGLFVHLRVGQLKFQIFPLKKPETDKKSPPKKREKKAKSDQKNEEIDQKIPEKKGGKFELVKMALPLVGEAAGALKRRIRIDKLFLDLTAGGRDAAMAAQTFGYANAAIGTILPIFQHNFDLKEYRVRTDIDFTAPAPKIYLNAAISARVGQLVSFGILLGCKALRVYLAYRKQVKARQADQTAPDKQPAK